MGVVAEMADRIMVMYSGQVVEYADARSIFTNPLHPYTRGLLASIPRLDKDVDVLYAIKGSSPVSKTRQKDAASMRDAKMQRKYAKVHHLFYTHRRLQCKVLEIY